VPEEEELEEEEKKRKRRNGEKEQEQEVARLYKRLQGMWPIIHPLSLSRDFD
jgi:hypothetical protein